jgi:membrane-bound lytic murein transglycosylase D
MRFFYGLSPLRYDRRLHDRPFGERSVTRAARPRVGGRLRRPRRRLLPPLLLPLLSIAAGETTAAGKGGPAPVPGVESLAERRAVRGVAVDEGPESPELAELRRFEEQAFPRGGGADSGADAVAGASVVSPAVAPAEAGLPGRWAGSGDVPEPGRPPGQAPAGPARPAPAATPDSEWLRTLKLPELPVRWDPHVLRYLHYFRSEPRGRAVMASWLRRAGRYRSLFEAALERQGLPKDLLYLAMIESGFETGARSRVGAGGIWQFMPGAARAYGLEVAYWVDARRDPERSVTAAVHHLKDLHVRFGSWPLVLAAYNAGYGAVLRSITRYNTNDYWELIRHESGLPWESSVYVPKILAAAIVGHNLGAFGFGEVVGDAPFVFEEVEVPPGTPLAVVARAVKVGSEVIAGLNPQLIRERTPPDRGPSRVRIPAGTSALFAAAFDGKGSGSGAEDRLEAVTLRFGERLEDVAKARGTTVRELKRVNAVRGDTAEVRAGVTILAPLRRGAAAPAAAAPAAAAPGEARQDGDPDPEILVAVPDRSFNYEGRERVFYRSRDGDTQAEIAETFGVRAEDLLEWNNLDPGARLHPGMVLQIFVRKDLDLTRMVLLDPAKVRVVTLGSEEFLELEAARRGRKRLVIEVKGDDTLAKLGRRYGLTPGDLARINRFPTSTDLRDGQKVVVYSPAGERPREVAHGRAPEARRSHGEPGTPKVATKLAPAPATRPAAKPATKLAAKTPVAAAPRTGGKDAQKAATAKAPPPSSRRAAPKSR